MKNTLDLSWKGKMAFETSLDGHKILLDANKDVGGEDKGPRPKQFMLIALAGCTGMDVVSILKKMRIDIKGLNIKVEADLTDEHPKHYTKINVIYEFTGKDLPYDKLEKAVNLSRERYCGVMAVYEKAMDMSSEIKINEG